MKRDFKGQIFLFDLIFAIVILIVSVGIFLTYFITTYENEDIYSLNYELMNSFTTTSINSLNDEGIRDFFSKGYIRNKDDTIAQQVASFYYSGEVSLAQNLTEIFVKNYLSKEMSYNVTISNSSDFLVLYQSDLRRKNLEDASIASVTRRAVFGYSKSDPSFVYGPYTITIQIWQ